MPLMEDLWAIEQDGELVCWDRSRGVPFLTPNHELAVDTARSGDVLERPRSGSARTVVLTRVISYQGMTMVLDPGTNHLRCLLKPVDAGV